MKAILQKVKWHAEILQPEFIGQAKLSEAEEVLVEIFGEVTTNELVATVVEGTCAVCTCMIAQCGPLGQCQYFPPT